MKPTLASRIRSFCLSVAWLAVAATGGAAAKSAPPFPLPATFTGTTPCADCPGIDVTLTLSADGTYVQRNLYRERSSFSEDSGTWSYESSSAGLILSAVNGSKQYYRVANSKTLEQLDAHGDPIVASGSFRLRLSPRVVALAAPGPPGLASNAWTIVTLNGANVTIPPGEKTPTLKFDASEKRVSGTGGCNNFFGSYRQDGPALTFSALGSTMMACPPPVDDVERRFLAALGKTNAFRIRGSVLELLDGSTILATFAAVR